MKQSSQKKETTLSVLKDIRALLKANNSFLAREAIAKPKEPTLMPNEIIVDFPELTAKQIVDACSNTVYGGKLLYNIAWYENEAFYTTETTHPGKRIISLDLKHAGKSWTEINKIIGGSLQMLNFAEVVYLLKENETFRKLLNIKNDVFYTWTNSRSSGGGLVFVGSFDSFGASVDDWGPGRSDSEVGVCFSRSESRTDD